MFSLLEVPKQIDAFIDGVVRFVYGALQALALVAAQPAKGSLRLARVAPNALSSKTVLLIAVAIYAALVGLVIQPADLFRAVVNEQKGGVIPYLIDVAVYYVIFDLAVLLLSLAAARRRRRRRRAVEMLRFAMAASLALVIIGAAAYSATGQRLTLSLPNLAGLVFGLCYPVWRVLLVIAPRPAKPRPVRHGLVFALRCLGISLAVGLAILAWSMSGTFAVSRSLHRPDVVLAHGVSCTVTAPALATLTMALTNASDKDLVIAGNDLTVSIYGTQVETLVKEVTSPGAGIFVVPAKSTAIGVFTAQMPLPPSQSWAPYRGCIAKLQSNRFTLEGGSAFLQPTKPPAS